MSPPNTPHGGGHQPATPTTIRLDDEEARIGGSIEQAQVDGLRADIWYRGLMVAVVALLFIGLNGAVMWFIRDAYMHDIVGMAAKPPLPASDRLVTTNVLLSLVGATVVQTGVGFIAIVSYLFPKRDS